ncbi:MAG: sulfite exporter TauE/SafE family protein [Verrucomicrobiota bacterium JB024]|nr:sulfite exporter TauE/SafE family protein [Verrucomicrobiota bacterium JB024]
MAAQLILILLAILLAAIIQASTGFGFGLVAVGILTVFMPVQDAAFLNALPALALNLTLIWRLYQYLQWDDLKWIALAIILATPIGVVGLLMLNARVMNGILAMVLAVAILRSVFNRSGARPWHPFWLGFPMGILSGLLAGAYGTGGPPVIAYVQSYRYEMHRHVVCLQLLLAIAGTIRVISLLMQNALTVEQWMLNGIGVLVIPLGALIGLYLLRRLPHSLLRNAILAMLVLIMVNCLVRSLV